MTQGHPTTPLPRCSDPLPPNILQARTHTGPIPGHFQPSSTSREKEPRGSQVPPQDPFLPQPWVTPPRPPSPSRLPPPSPQAPSQALAVSPNGGDPLLGLGGQIWREKQLWGFF